MLSPQAFVIDLGVCLTFHASCLSRWQFSGNSRVVGKCLGDRTHTWVTRAKASTTHRCMEWQSQPYDRDKVKLQGIECYAWSWGYGSSWFFIIKQNCDEKTNHNGANPPCRRPPQLLFALCVSHKTCNYKWGSAVACTRGSPFWVVAWCLEDPGCICHFFA